MRVSSGFRLLVSVAVGLGICVGVGWEIVSFMGLARISFNGKQPVGITIHEIQHSGDCTVARTTVYFLVARSRVIDIEYVRNMAALNSK